MKRELSWSQCGRSVGRATLRQLCLDFIFCFFNSTGSESAVGAMATKEMWEQIGEGFVGEYYRRFDKNELRPSLGELYGNDSCLTWEGEGFPGRTAIVGKLTGLPFGAIQHVITSQDHQPTPDNCIVSMVTGQLKADNDPVMGFQQIFMLKLQDGAWVCTNDIFRLALHNFAA